MGRGVYIGVVLIILGILGMLVVFNNGLMGYAVFSQNNYSVSEYIPNDSVNYPMQGSFLSTSGLGNLNVSTGEEKKSIFFC